MNAKDLITNPQPDCPFCQNPSVEMIQFKEQVSDRAKEIDPDNEHDWHSLTIGWALAKGYLPDPAYRFATHIRYHTNLG